MNAVLVVVVVLLACLALVVGVTGLLGLLGRLPGNGVLGVRTPETRRSPEAWTLANRAAGPALLGSSLMLMLGALGVGLIGGWVGGLVVVVALLGSLALLSVAGLAGSRAAALWEDAQDDDEGGCGCGSEGGCGGHSAGDPGTSDAPGAGSCGDSPADPADPAADCGVTGGCGSCALQGMCDSESTTTR
ncbi:SdpI family protein [Dietzia cercidiphylli]|uniref:SdpI family protein n=2 Tax=Dietzia cercidiphylli TaxID=498199 RepID=UPI00223B6940|nr:SdpI family protein [Dietzia cercidiphylli]MCT1514099.1 SdpI family protein [Dietzia cercidiphylli]